MQMKLFYDSNISGDFHVLNEEESKHCSKVLRLKIGDELFLTDGCGNLYKCELAELHQKKTILRILKKIADYGKRDYNLHLAVAPTKNNDRFEWFVEKSTEIGIDEITPVICKNSERRIIKIDRLNRITEAAMKQSYKAYHPKINEQIDLLEFLKQDCNYEQKFIAYCEEHHVKAYLGDVLKPNGSVLVLIGPEGDFSLQEIDAAKAAGFVMVTLGDSRLRTETAVVVACTLVSVINGMNK